MSSILDIEYRRVDVYKKGQEGVYNAGLGYD
jgi:hypothetical protein